MNQEEHVPVGHNAEHNNNEDNKENVIHRDNI